MTRTDHDPVLRYLCTHYHGPVSQGTCVHTSWPSPTRYLCTHHDPVPQGTYVHTSWPSPTRYLCTHIMIQSREVPMYTHHGPVPCCTYVHTPWLSPVRYLCILHDTHTPKTWITYPILLWADVNIWWPGPHKACLFVYWRCFSDLIYIPCTCVGHLLAHYVW